MLIPINWYVDVMDEIIIVRGECKREEGLPSMIARAIQISCEAFCFDGYMCQGEQKPGNSNYVVSFTHYFKEKTKAADFIEYLTG